MSERYRLLIVDDDPDMLRNLALMLSLEGYSIMTASSGVAACILLTEHTFDVVITDLRMPIVDGFEIVRRTQDLLPKAGIIVTSRYIDDETRVWLSGQHGVCGLEKPYNILQMSSILRDFQLQQPLPSI